MRVSIENTIWGFHIRLRSDDREEFDYALERFKAHVPKSCRRFKADQGYWFVEQRCMKRINLWLSLLHGEMELEVEIDGKTESMEPEREDRLSKAFEALHLRESAPLVLVRAARRVLATLEHPDCGGSEDVMKQINSSADLIERQLAGRSSAP